MKRKFNSQLEAVVPNALGMQLSEEQTDQIAQTFYSRFYQGSGKPDWKCALNDDARKAATRLVKQVVDAMTLCDYQIMKG